MGAMSKIQKISVVLAFLCVVFLAFDKIFLN